MSRINVHRNLPALKKVLKRQPRVPKGKSLGLVMIETMRDVAGKLRTARSQPFYAMREVAEFFHTPVSMVFPVYAALEREGIISRIRGSHTILNGLEIRSRQSVRGVVGLPVGMVSLVKLPYTQTLLEELEKRLGRLGYIADIVFNLDFRVPDGAMGLLSRNLDAVIVHSALPNSHSDIRSLCERGVRVLVVQRKDTQLELPGLNYLQDYQTAYEKMAARWHQIGIRKVWLCTPPEYLYDTTELENMKKILHQAGLKTESIPDEPDQLLNRVRAAKPKMSTAIAFLDSIHSELICNGEPEIMAEISRYARLAFCVGHIRLPGLRRRGIRADIIDFSATEVATKLVDDISRLSVLRDGICHTFIADYNEQEML